MKGDLPGRFARHTYDIERSGALSYLEFGVDRSALFAGVGRIRRVDGDRGPRALAIGGASAPTPRMANFGRRY